MSQFEVYVSEIVVNTTITTSKIKSKKRKKQQQQQQQQQPQPQPYKHLGNVKSWKTKFQSSARSFPVCLGDMV